MSNIAVSPLLPSELLALIADPDYTVVVGATSPSDEPPIVACWPVQPIVTADGLAAEDWGQLHDVWVLNCFGLTVAQSLGVRDRVLSKAFGDSWLLTGVSGSIEDTVAVPSWWFVAITVRYIETT
jgi:hypothetical protein